MPKMSGTKPRFTAMLFEIILVSVFLQVALSFDITEDDNHQSLFPLSHSDRQGYWAFVEEKSPSGVSSYTRLGRKVYRLPQTLIPYPRTGRMLVDPEVYDYDVSLVPDYTWNSFDYPLSDNFLESKSVSKRGSIAFPPRIGRKKRSISDEDSESDNHANSKKLPRMANSDWSFLDDVEPDFYMRQERRTNSRSRNAFVPRVGKKRSDEDLDDIEDKRALAFTPRIGRASLIPRIGRNDPRFEVKSRGAFIPRIGRRAALTPRIGRAALTPRIGRSGSHQSSNDETK